LRIKHLSSSTRITLKKEGKTVREINQYLSEWVKSELASMFGLMEFSKNEARYLRRWC
jgi:hypothetical protein